MSGKSFNKIGYTWALILLLFSFNSLGQRLNFSNYTVEHGLIQSQVYSIAQDKYGMIWAATLGGISRFDGHNFYNYDINDGLNSAIVLKIFFDDNNKLWIGTQEGVQIFDGKKFTTIPLPPNLAEKFVTDIKQDKEGHIYLLCGERIVVVGNHKTDLLVLPQGHLSITSISINYKGNLCAVMNGEAVYEYTATAWQLLFDPPLKKSGDEYVALFDSTGLLWYAGRTKIYVIDGHSLINEIDFNNGFNVHCLESGNEGSIWIGTSGGAYMIDKNHRVIFCGSSKGGTNNAVRDILKDMENNIWLGSDTEGLFKLTESPFVYYNKSSGLKGDIVMGFARVNGKMYVGMADGGLAVYNKDQQFESITVPSQKAEAQKISCLLGDSRSRLWTGTINGGLWVYEKNLFREIKLSDGNSLPEIISLYEDRSGTVWIGTVSGVYVYKNRIVAIPGITDVGMSFLQIENDSMLIGTTGGLLILSMQNPSKWGAVTITRSAITALSRYGDYVVAGTRDHGIYYWNLKTRELLHCGKQEGLTSAFVYSLFRLDQKSFLAGTGNSIYRFQLDSVNKSFSVKRYSVLNMTTGPECNLNAIITEAPDKVWIGTVKGLIIYHLNFKNLHAAAPLVYLKSVSLFSKRIDKPDSLIAWNSLPFSMLLKPDENHITFDLTGIYFTNPGEIKYQYTLQGADTGYSILSNAQQVVYPNLSPGKYIFKANAITSDGTHSSNTVQFPFEIAPHYYQQNWFRLLLVLFLIGIGWAIQSIRLRIRQKRTVAIEVARLEEQKRIRERTSEELHDDLGNKITRINILADILQRKIAEDDIDKKNLLYQIKENGQSLYLGMKDVIWSLTPGNDNLYDTMDRMKSFGIQLFEDTEIEFSFRGITPEMRNVSLSFEASRNLIMIMKEAMTNILKHSHATQAAIKVTNNNNVDFTMRIMDNGKGILFPLNSGGNGLENIKKRAERLGGELTISADDPQGTILRIDLKIPPKKG